MPGVLFSILTPLLLPSSSVSLSYFILTVPMRECLGKHSCMSSPFPIAILNGTSFFLSFFSLWCKREKMPSGHYYRLCSRSGRSNHLNMPCGHYYRLCSRSGGSNHLIKKNCRQVVHLHGLTRVARPNRPAVPVQMPHASW